MPRPEVDPVSWTGQLRRLSYQRPSLELRRADLTERQVPPLLVIEHFNSMGSGGASSQRRAPVRRPTGSAPSAARHWGTKDKRSDEAVTRRGPEGTRTPEARLDSSGRDAVTRDDSRQGHCQPGTLVGVAPEALDALLKRPEEERANVALEMWPSLEDSRRAAAFNLSLEQSSNSTVAFTSIWRNRRHRCSGEKFG